jgi:hypothetical protein
MTTNLDRARLVSQHVQLEQVVLSRANVASELNPMRIAEVVQPSQKHRCRYQLPDDDEGHLWVYVDFEFSASPAGEANVAALMTLTGTYLLVYALANARSYPADALQHFSWLNGAYNAWPYWRELVQTVAGRVGFGNIVIPVYRPTVKTLEAEEPSTVGEPAS